MVVSISIWVCLKMVSTPKPNGFAEHFPYENRHWTPRFSRKLTEGLALKPRTLFWSVKEFLYLSGNPQRKPGVFFGVQNVDCHFGWSDGDGQKDVDPRWFSPSPYIMALRNQCRKDATMENGTDLVAHSRRVHHIPGDWQIGQVVVVCLSRGSAPRKPWYFREKTQEVPIFFHQPALNQNFPGKFVSPPVRSDLSQVELEPPLLFLLWMEPYQGICRDKGFISQQAISCLLFSIVAVFVFVSELVLGSCLGCVGSCQECVSNVCPPAAALVGSLCPFPVPLREVPDFKPQRRPHGYVIVGVMIGQCGKSTQNRIHPNSQHIKCQHIFSHLHRMLKLVKILWTWITFVMITTTPTWAYWVTWSHFLLGR